MRPPPGSFHWPKQKTLRPAHLAKQRWPDAAETHQFQSHGLRSVEGVEQHRSHQLYARDVSDRGRNIYVAGEMEVI